MALFQVVPSRLTLPLPTQGLVRQMALRQTLETSIRLHLHHLRVPSGQRTKTAALLLVPSHRLIQSLQLQVSAAKTALRAARMDLTRASSLLRLLLGTISPSICLRSKTQPPRKTMLLTPEQRPPSSRTTSAQVNIPTGIQDATEATVAADDDRASSKKNLKRKASPDARLNSDVSKSFKQEES